MWDVSSFSTPYSKYVLKQYIVDNKYDVFADQQLRLVIELNENKKAIGTVDITDLSIQHLRGMIGIAVLREYRQKGIGKRALTLLCEYALNFLHFHQVYAYIATDNEASLSLFQSCGFQQTGIMKEWLHIGDTWIDVALMQKINFSYGDRTSE